MRADKIVSMKLVFLWCLAVLLLEYLGAVLEVADSLASGNSGKGSGTNLWLLSLVVTVALSGLWKTQTKELTVLIAGQGLCLLPEFAPTATESMLGLACRAGGLALMTAASIRIAFYLLGPTADDDLRHLARSDSARALRMKEARPQSQSSRAEPARENAMSWLRSAVGVFVVLTSVIGVLAITLAGFLVFQVTSPRVVQELPSPSGAVVGRVYRLREGGDPPYGTSVAIVSSSLPWVWGFGHPVFRFDGCAGDLSLVWEHDQKLWIECKGLGASPDPRFINVRHQESHLGAIQIGYRVLSRGPEAGE
jgi:hypothetical protein